ncbi:glucose-6-phosphate dehydrogenase [Streptomyces sp. UH6]|uniref:glucose-6-phosphate dehydrogenase n=1 Tax=Streptomyces sp. UH6 TaxID=2748379 RepID=UPI0015D4E23E|nr:glucose-6-phosphate dehydrogenase [Streptomyces sp. UH6]NYV72891.1 glucose-6-phosphate dehydrogenase [Streptomyces sp. UH6]
MNPPSSAPPVGQEHADAMVVFGITGDLAKKMLLPALYELVRSNTLTVPVYGAGRSDWDDDRLHRHARECVEAAAGPVEEAALTRLTGLLHYARVDYEDPVTFADLAATLRPYGFVAHYVAVPPAVYPTIARRLGEAGLHTDARLVVEKPFGHDAASARELQDLLLAHFPEDRLRRVDHFLGKEVVQNLLTLRFANPVIDSLLHRDRVRSVQVTMAEDFDVADRGGFYDSTGCLRDVVENHVFQTLSYFLMEAPRSAAASDILDERTRALRAIRTVLPGDYVTGQYEGYQDTEGVAPASRTETYTALRLFVDTPRWSGVPFTVRAGKAMAASAIELIVEYDRAVPGYFHTREAERAAPDLLRLRISPRPGFTFSLLSQDAGGTTELRQDDAVLDFSHLDGSDVGAYVRVLRDTLSGDPRLFVRMDMVEECWRIVGDILDPVNGPVTYPVGGWGPAEADRLVPGGHWFPLEQVRQRDAS